MGRRKKTEKKTKPEQHFPFALSGEKGKRRDGADEKGKKGR